MTSISQIIPNYSTGGISDQPDELKKPGQLRKCVNAYPDLVHGLYRRPGFELLGTLGDPCSSNANINKTGTWFPYVRQEATTGEQQNFLFNISREGVVRAYDINGNNVDVHYANILKPGDLVKGDIDITDFPTCQTSSDIEDIEQEYLKHQTNNSLRTVAINDLIVVVNPDSDNSISMSGQKSSATNKYEAFIDITQLAYNKEYKLGFNELDTSQQTAHTIEYTEATGVNIYDAGRFRTDNASTGDCPLIVSGTVTVDNTYLHDGTTDNGQANLEIEINTRGTQKLKRGNYKCEYNHTVTLKNGGENWKVGDKILIYHNVGASPKFSNAKRVGYDDPFYRIEITDVNPVTSPNDYEATASINSTATPAVGMGDLLEALKNSIVNANNVNTISPNIPFQANNVKIVGNGIHIRHDHPFSVIALDSKNLMNVLSGAEESDVPYAVVNNVSNLPLQCVDGFVVKVANSFVDSDDYWVKFKTDHGTVTKDSKATSTGYWEEVAEPGGMTRLNSANMPHVILFKQVDNKPAFLVGKLRWPKRTCGNEELNPSFVGSTINNVHFYRNRLVFLSDENVIMSRAGDLFNFFPATALNVAPSDPIDLSVSTSYSSVLKDSIVINNGLVLFSKYQQFVLNTANDILSPSTAKIAEISRYEYDVRSKPFALGTNIGFMGLATDKSVVFELTNVFSEGPVDVIDRSKIVSKTLKKDLYLIADSKETGVVFFGKRSTNRIFGLRYFREGNQNTIQSCWFRWDLPDKLVNHFIIDGYYYAVIDDPSDNDNDDEQGNNNARYVRLKLDDLPTNGPFFDLWLASDPTDKTHAVDYTTTIEFPTINVLKPEQQAFRADTTASLVVHRTNWNFADIGSYEFVISRSGMDDYTVLYESRYMDAYNADDSPVVAEVERTVPVYTRNTDLGIKLQSDFEHPLVLHSMRWEGDYNSRYYQRV